MKPLFDDLKILRNGRWLWKSKILWTEVCASPFANHPKLIYVLCLCVFDQWIKHDNTHCFTDLDHQDEDECWPLGSVVTNPTKGELQVIKHSQLHGWEQFRCWVLCSSMGGPHEKSCEYFLTKRQEPWPSFVFQCSRGLKPAPFIWWWPAVHFSVT